MRRKYHYITLVMTETGSDSEKENMKGLCFLDFSTYEKGYKNYKLIMKMKM